jgi:hypothetical protein
LFGKSLEVEEILRFGGPPKAGLSDAQLLEQPVLMVGDLTGAYAGVPDPVLPVGPACDPSASSSGCPAGSACVTDCPMSSPGGLIGRCLRACSVDADCGSSDLARSCAPFGASGNFCQGPALVCTEPRTIWEFVNVLGLAKGAFGDGTFEDAVAVGSGSPVPGIEGQGEMRLIFGDRIDPALLLDGSGGTSIDLIARPFALRAPPQRPRRVVVGDFNGDHHDDLAVLFIGVGGEIHVWLGAGNRGVGEISQGPIMGCNAACSGTTCSPAQALVAGDFDGDGVSELVGACESNDATEVTLRRFKSIAIR